MSPSPTLQAVPSVYGVGCTNDGRLLHDIVPLYPNIKAMQLDLTTADYGPTMAARSKLLEGREEGTRKNIGLFQWLILSREVKNP